MPKLQKMPQRGEERSNNNKQAALQRQDQEFQTRMSLPEDVRTEVAQQLNKHLAEAADLYMASKSAHWNVKGKDFYQLHLLFDKVAETILPQVDEIGERITAIGHRALGTIQCANEGTQLPPYPIDITAGMDHVRALADHVAEYANHLREGIEFCEDKDDQVSMDLLTGLAGEADQLLYFLEAHLQDPQ